MKIPTIIASIFLVLCLSACQAEVPESVTAKTASEFSLFEGQTAEVSDAGITITFVSLSGDSRCPLGKECAMSGPVTLSLAIRDQGGTQTTEVLQTFTDILGLAPDMEFEGIKDRTTVDRYLVKIISVLPYPESNTFSIGEPDYQITLKVTKE
ncbi:MAG: hypothetical protein JNM55_21465 [Anaerolineales bacterium]|nr:hypothetical protein [Anaerolineales bacterium]